MSDMMIRIAYIHLGFISLTITLLFIREIVNLCLRLTKKFMLLIRGNSFLKENQDKTIDSERRLFLIRSLNSGVLFSSTLLTCYGLFEAYRDPIIRRIIIPIVNLPDNFENFRIVQITDLHIGPTIKGDYVRRVVELSNQLSPNLIALTGDLADGFVTDLKKDTAPLATLRASHGKFFVTGNHEYYWEPNAWIEEVKRLGFTPLLNEGRIIKEKNNSIFLAGVTDFQSERYRADHISSPHKALNGKGGNLVKILLAHQPRTIFDAAHAGYDLQISGHTHGGQFFPGTILTALVQPYVSGLHRLKKTWIYVSSGTGYWGPPLRIGTRSEITLIELRKYL